VANKLKVIAAGSGMAANTPTDCVAHVPMGPGSKYGAGGGLLKW
jgi:hypothetical protein